MSASHQHPTARLGYVPALDGLRGVAIALVLADHVGWLPGGFLGVDVFFVLSGFLITTLLLDEWERGNRIALRSFYLRRARRLLPALVALLLLLGIFALLDAASGKTSAAAEIAKGIAVCLFYVANFWRTTGHSLASPLQQMWSLAEEEQFYILWPPLLIVALRLRVRLGGLAVSLAAAAVAVMVWRAHLGSPGPNFFSPETRCDPLLIGCLLGVLRQSGTLPRVSTMVATIAGAALAADIWFASSEWGSWGFTTRLGFPIAALATAVLIVAVLDDSARLLRFSPIVRLGVISYSLYVWHVLVLVSFDGAAGPRNLIRSAAILVSIAIAWLSYRYIEQPFRKRRRVSRAPASALTAPIG
jgi:peptidoglycan/LPS O-acetylase OafA/YrhL